MHARIKKGEREWKINMYKCGFCKRKLLFVCCWEIRKLICLFVCLWKIFEFSSKYYWKVKYFMISHISFSFFAEIEYFCAFLIFSSWRVNFIEAYVILNMDKWVSEGKLKFLDFVNDSIFFLFLACFVFVFLFFEPQRVQC